MKNRKHLAALALTAALLCLPGVTATAADSGAQPVPGASQPQEQGRCHGHHGHMAGGFAELAGLTGMTQQELMQKYPQKTAWQIAAQLGKLDALKAAVRSSHKAMFDKMVTEGVITAADRDKMMADLDKRLAPIDGKNIVILGRPGYRPEFKKDGFQGRAPSASSKPAA